MFAFYTRKCCDPSRAFTSLSPSPITSQAFSQFSFLTLVPPFEFKLKTLTSKRGELHQGWAKPRIEKGQTLSWAKPGGVWLWPHPWASLVCINGYNYTSQAYSGLLPESILQAVSMGWDFEKSIRICSSLTWATWTEVMLACSWYPLAISQDWSSDTCWIKE